MNYLVTLVIISQGLDRDNAEHAKYLLLFSPCACIRG
jgi:hypothetical protein